MLNNYNELGVWELRENPWVPMQRFGKFVLNEGGQNDKIMHVLNMKICS
jgi:hypothetical protein